MQESCGSPDQQVHKIMKRRWKKILNRKLPVYRSPVNFAGNVPCDPVTDHFALNSGNFRNNSLVVIKVAIEAFSVLFEKGDAH